VKGWNMHSQKYSNVKFVNNSILEVVPEEFDVILGRDLISHYSLDAGVQILNNLKSSGAKYLLANTYATTTQNSNIEIGKWFPVNLTLPPYNLPTYSDFIEDWPNDGTNCYGKLMALWSL
jgi:hypothetical protein